MDRKVEKLTRRKDKLKASASEATTLAQAERQLADQQHLVAHNLEILAEDLAEQVNVVEAEIKASKTD